MKKIKKLTTKLIKKLLERKYQIPMNDPGVFFHKVIWQEAKDFEEIYNVTRGYTDISIGKMLMLYQFLLQIKSINGAIAECGVAYGGTAYLIAKTLQQIDSNKELFLLDSYEGMPETDVKYNPSFKRGDYGNTSLDLVKKKFMGFTTKLILFQVSLKKL